MDAMNRIRTKTESTLQASFSQERWEKWHPKPKTYPCPYCPKAFDASGRLQLHAMCYSYHGEVGMCGWDKQDRLAFMSNAPYPRG